jgi:hypothetical protein
MLGDIVAVGFVVLLVVGSVLAIYYTIKEIRKD